MWWLEECLAAPRQRQLFVIHSVFCARKAYDERAGVAHMALGDSAGEQKVHELLGFVGGKDAVLAELN